MKAALHTTPGVLEFREVPEPVPGPGQIKIRIEYAGICGTDAECVFERIPMEKLHADPKGPWIEGHEASGTIAELGPGVRQDFSVGERVGLGFRAGCGVCYYCRNDMEHLCEYELLGTGAWAQYAVLPEGAVFPLSQAVPFERAALVEPMSIAVRLMDLAGVKTGQSLLIAGGGSIGLLTLAVALNAGVSPVVVSEPKAVKREIALRMGAAAAVDPLADGGAELVETAARLTGGRGFRACVEASGNVAAAGNIVDMADKGGTIVWGASYPHDAGVVVNPDQMFLRDLTIRSAWRAPYVFYRAIDLVTRLDLSEIVTSIYPLEEAQAAFDKHLEGESVKTLLKCW
jgi:L-iditol 2-dehydrogenase